MLAERENLSRDQENPEDVKGTVFNIQRFSVQDGPGIRTTVFLKGCPLRCAWCSNPESQNAWPEIVHRDSLCNKCGRCADVCDVKAISFNERGVSIDRELCTNCGKCAAVCVPGALKILGEEMTAGEVFRQVKKDEQFYRESGGGVTVSGGEPLFQADFVAALFRLCREKGIPTCIETCGLAGRQAWEKVLPYTDLVLYDVKLSDPASHQRWTKAPNDEIMRNLGIVAASGVPVIVRIPLIPGVNDSEDELKGIARIAADSHDVPVRVNLLPYHRFGMGKYQQLDREYALGELTTQTEAEIQKAREIFDSSGFECEIVR
jgi:pyruvate formate lyase activating enzyme